MQKNKRSAAALPIGMCLGISIGTAIGAATKNIGLWMPIGLSIGMCLGLVFLRGEKEPAYDFRVISNQVRFGCGYREHEGKRQYFAWHGVPNRNDDYFTTTEISREEYEQIAKEYPREIIADRETAEVFRKKYVEGHPVILEGTNKLL